MFQFLLDLLFPPKCVSCQAAESWFCGDCLSKIAFLSDSVCYRCGTPMTNPTSPCRYCQNQLLQNIDGMRAVSYFENNPIKSAIYALKYHNHKAVATILAQLLADAYQRYHLKADVIVPVPLHISRYQERGYNQSELLAKELSRRLDLPLNSVNLSRIRKTDVQAKLGGVAERRLNVSNAFSCNGKSLSGQHVLLVDDVCTTGSTLDACAVALKAEGVNSVWGLTLAKA